MVDSVTVLIVIEQIATCIYTYIVHKNEIGNCNQYIALLSDKMKKKKLLFELTKAISKVDESMVKMTISQDVDLDATIIYSKTPLSYSLEMDAENITS